MHASLFQPLGVSFVGTFPQLGLSASAYLQGQVFARRLASAASTSSTPFVPSSTDAHWEPLSNMNPASPELLFDGATGDVLMGWVS